MQTRRILVIGSLNVDVSCRVERLPTAGETVAGSSLLTGPGGKGANQAIGAGRLGGDVAMVGRVGADPYGDLLRSALRDAGVSDAAVGSLTGVPTGTALICVDQAGQNQIVVVGGANAAFTPDDLDPAVIRESALIMAQLEIPLETVTRAFGLGAAAGVPTILDPAPARPLPRELLEQVTWLTPNQHEAEMLVGRPIRDEAAAEAAARELARMGPRYVVLKLGAHGALLCWGETVTRVAPFQVAAVDTTAAGDAFGAGLAVALVEGRAPEEAVRFASAAGALATTRSGAAAAMPARDEVEALLLVTQ